MKRFTLLFLAAFSVLALVSCDNGNDNPVCSDPAIPTLVSPTSGAEVQGPDVAVDWDGQNATDFLAELYDGKTCGGTALKSINASATQGSWTGLTNGKSYSWRVQGINNACTDPRESAWSACWWFTVANCPAPTKPALSSPANGATVTGTSVTATWQAATNATRYTAERFSGGNCSGTAVQTVPTTTTQAPFTGLVDGDTYSWRVVAEKDAAGTCPAASVTSDCWSFHVGSAPPTLDAPVLKSPCNAAVNRTSVKLSWKAVDGATHYRGELYIGYNCNTTAVTPFSAAAPKTDYTFPLLEPLQVYSWRVKAENQTPDPDVTSRWSDCCLFDTLQ